MLLLLAAVSVVALSEPSEVVAQSKTAQASEEKDYLPPWERGEGEPAGPREPDSDDTGYEAPKRITPPPRERAGDGYPGGPDYPGRGSYERDYGGLPKHEDDHVGAPPPPHDRYYRGDDETFSSNEIIAAGERFFGTVSSGLAKVVEHAFAEQGRPNGYILGEEAGGAFVAGLRYGEGVLYTKNAGTHKVYWQGPSVGYDFGAEGSKTMILVYNLHDIDDIYHRFAGVDGSAYLVGGIGITFQTHGDVVLAPIRSGVGLRLGANVGYLKYTREPTWNPF